jgi:hypothetical protein
MDMAFFKRKKKKKKKLGAEGGGIILFTEVAKAMRAEKVLKDSEFTVKMVAPPAELRLGCDLAVKITLVEQPGIEHLLKERHIPYKEIASLKKGTPELLNMVKVIDLGDWIMVKAGNMKLTFEKSTGIIVNTSGGGCPDIPFLNFELLGKTLTEAPRPADLGRTLCARMLDRAFEEAFDIHKGK